MNKLPLLIVLAIVAAGCSNTPELTTQPATDATATTAEQPTASPSNVAREIDSIIYSDLSKDQMLEKLKQFVSVMDSYTDFRKKTGLENTFGSGSSYGVMERHFRGCGLIVVTDPDEKIRVLIRNPLSVNGKDYPGLTITDRYFEWKNHKSWYGY